MVTVSFSASELAYLPAYPETAASVTAVSEFVRLPLVFEGEGGLRAETEIVVPRGNGDFEYDEDAVPTGTSMDCATGFVWFGKEGCQPESLRALAKYDAFVGQ